MKCCGQPQSPRVLSQDRAHPRDCSKESRSSSGKHSYDKRFKKLLGNNLQNLSTAIHFQSDLSKQSPFSDRIESMKRLVTKKGSNRKEIYERIFNKETVSEFDVEESVPKESLKNSLG